MTVFTDMQASQAVAKKFEEDGYVVTLEPNPAEIPFDIHGYRPDLLAVKPGDNVIVEVKRPGSKVNSKLYLRVAECAAAHPGWSFKLVTWSDHLSEPSSQREGQLEQIRPLLAKVETLSSHPGFEGMAIVMLWNAYIYALQFLVAEHSARASTLSDLGLLNLAYTLGILDYEEVVQARRFLDLRNRAVHAISSDVVPADVVELQAQLKKVLERIPNMAV